MKILITLDIDKWNGLNPFHKRLYRLLSHIIQKRICKILLPKQSICKIVIDEVHQKSIVSCNNLNRITNIMNFIYEYFIPKYPEFKVVYVETDTNASFFTNVERIFTDKETSCTHNEFIGEYLKIIKRTLNNSRIGFYYDTEYGKMNNFTIRREISGR